MQSPLIQTPVQLVECPRDAMQGWPRFIPTDTKVAYLNSLLRVGFHTLDFGSFVSPKAIPQMADTKEVVARLDMTDTSTKLLAIVANEKGAEDAAGFHQINCLGFPFSISETFQQRNTNSSMQESLKRVETIQALCGRAGKQLVVYLSMGFGNPYGDPYNEQTLLRWAGEMIDRGIEVLSLADTVGLATAEQISFALATLQKRYPSVTIGVHLHATATNWKAKLNAALAEGCSRIDGALKGIGGCPMAGDALVGNMDTEHIVETLREHNRLPALNEVALKESSAMAATVFV